MARATPSFGNSENCVHESESRKKITEYVTDYRLTILTSLKSMARWAFANPPGRTYRQHSGIGEPDFQLLPALAVLVILDSTRGQSLPIPTTLQYFQTMCGSDLRKQSTVVQRVTETAHIILAHVRLIKKSKVNFPQIHKYFEMVQSMHTELSNAAAQHLHEHVPSSILNAIKRCYCILIKYTRCMMLQNRTSSSLKEIAWGQNWVNDHN